MKLRQVAADKIIHGDFVQYAGEVKEIEEVPVSGGDSKVRLTFGSGAKGLFDKSTTLNIHKEY